MPLLKGVISLLEHAYNKRVKLPYPSIAHFKEFETSDNTITATLKGIPYPGLESLAFLLFADKLIDLRPSYKETLAEKIIIDKSKQVDKSLSDDDVWFSHLEIPDEHTLVIHFLVLSFETREKMKGYLESDVQLSP